eukprot:1323160-Pleurochrysis_carterae.AAC.1
MQRNHIGWRNVATFVNNRIFHRPFCAELYSHTTRRSLFTMAVPRIRSSAPTCSISLVQVRAPRRLTLTIMHGRWSARVAWHAQVGERTCSQRPNGRTAGCGIARESESERRERARGRESKRARARERESERAREGQRMRVRECESARARERESMGRARGAEGDETFPHARTYATAPSHPPGTASASSAASFRPVAA